MVVASVEATLFVVRLFFKVWMKNPAVIGRIIVFVAVGEVENVKCDLIWVGFGSGPNVDRFEFFLYFIGCFYFSPAITP